MSIFDHEDDLVEPEAHHPGTLQGEEYRDRLCAHVFVVANGCSYEEANGSEHGDERHDCLICTITSLIIVSFIAAWAL